MELTVPWGRRERIDKMNKQSHDGWCQILSREIKHHLGLQSAKRVKQGRREWDLMEQPLVDEGAYQVGTHCFRRGGCQLQNYELCKWMIQATCSEI